MYSFDLEVKKVPDRPEPAESTVLLALGWCWAFTKEKITAGSILLVTVDLSDLVLQLNCIHLSARQGSTAYLNLSTYFQDPGN